MDFLLSLLRYTAPVGFAAIGEAVGQRAGMLNIGLEGMMLSAAYFATVAAESTGSPWLGMLAGLLAALALGGLQSVFTLKLGADQVVVGTAVNLLALGLTSTLFRARYGQSGQLLSVPTLPRFAGGLDLMLILLLALTAYLAWMLVHTRRGLAIRAAGEYPEAIAAAGFRPLRVRLFALAVGAALAGLGGAYLALGVAGSFAANMTAGRGFMAIALVTFGRWRPAWVLGAALLVGATEALQYAMKAAQSPLPGELLTALPYLVALGVLFFAGKGVAAPAKLGEPYRESA